MQIFRLLTFQTSFKNSLQTKSKLFSESLWNKGQSKKKRKSNDDQKAIPG